MDSNPHVTSPLESFQPHAAGSDVSPEPETFDHNRLVSLVDTLERDIAAMRASLLGLDQPVPAAQPKRRRFASTPATEDDS